MEIIVAMLVVVSVVMQDIWLDIITVGVIALAFILESRNQPFLINPYSLFVPTLVSLLIYRPVSHQYMLDLSHEIYLLCNLHFVCFYIVLRVGIIKTQFIKSKQDIMFSTDAKLAANTLSFALGVFGLFIPALSSFSWILIFFGLSGLYSESKKVFFVLLVFYLSIVLKSFAVSKLFLLNVLLFLAILYQKRRITWKRSGGYYLRMAFIGLLMTLFLFRFGNKDRGHTDSMSNLSYYSNQGVDWSLSPELFLPYMYVTTPWTNLKYVVDTQDERTYGLWMLKPVLGYVGLDFKETLNFKAFSSFNTFTFIAVFFKDFGYYGSLFGTVILASFVVLVYRLYLSTNFGVVAGLYSIVALAVLQMYFSNHFVMQSYPFTALLLFSIVTVLRVTLRGYG